MTYALPFFELIRSAISRQRARLGSKFWGSTAFSILKSDRAVSGCMSSKTYEYIAAEEFAPVR